MSLFGGKLDSEKVNLIDFSQFMRIINAKISSSPGRLSSGHTVKPNSILKAGAFW